MPRWKPHVVDFPADDRIARLFIHYFGPCRELYAAYQRACYDKTRKGERTRSMEVREITYALLWLSSLFAVVEGFRALKLNDSAIDRLSAEHWNSLRHLRNGTFHFQPKADKQIQFFIGSPGRLEWAKQLHDALTAYFSEYKINRAVQKFNEEHGPSPSKTPVESQTASPKSSAQRE
jgi:hypothetical protein